MRYLILVVDDEREVLDNVVADIEEFSSHFDIEGAESADEALEIIEEYEKKDEKLALILCDHLMPGVLGVDFLVQLHHRDQTKASKKILLTGQAGHQDTIKAVNDADLDHYISKPWELKELHDVLVRFLTDFVLAECESPMEFTDLLNGEKIFEFIHDKGEY